MILKDLNICNFKLVLRKNIEEKASARSKKTAILTLDRLVDKVQWWSLLDIKLLYSED